MTGQGTASALVDLVRGIVLAQGNVFIKELLREKNLPIGATKADFERNLLQAIQGGGITQQDIEGWLEQVEGWGDQHIYLFNVPREICRDRVWRDPERVRAHVAAAGLDAYWNAPTTHAFPPSMTLTGIRFDGATFQVSWHRGSESWVRVPTRDYQEPIDGDLYEFRAYRYRAQRAVTRFVLRLGGEDEKTWRAAIFIPVAIDSPEHGELLGQVGEVLHRLEALFSLAAVRSRQVIVASVIRALDAALLDAPASGGPRVTSQTTRLLAEGAYVEFGSLHASDDYRKSTAVRRVRRSIHTPQLSSFVGSSGRLQFLAGEAAGLSRDVKVQLYGDDKRIRIWRRLTAGEVWAILDVLGAHQ